jgi:hypothetical protein
MKMIINKKNAIYLNIVIVLMAISPTASAEDFLLGVVQLAGSLAGAIGVVIWLALAAVSAWAIISGVINMLGWSKDASAGTDAQKGSAGGGSKNAALIRFSAGLVGIFITGILYGVAGDLGIEGQNTISAPITFEQ